MPTSDAKKCSEIGTRFTTMASNPTSKTFALTSPSPWMCPGIHLAQLGSLGFSLTSGAAFFGVSSVPPCFCSRSHRRRRLSRLRI